ncbi:MAG: hypothetical protein GX754_06305 [Clostridiaceae bacterium]|nr:hypothetical protein [Clostridiaceae bacterium]
MKAHYEAILKQTEKSFEQLAASFVTDESSFNHGGFLSYTEGLAHPGSATSSLVTLVPLYFNKDSKYYRDEKLYDMIIKVLDYITRVQRPDGTFDLLTTNFYSSPDAGFLTQSMAHAYWVAEKCGGHDEESERIKARLFGIIKKAGYGMVTGGFHTPNHRWVIAAALMMAYNITGEKPFEEMANRYLNEGIDCDEYGEYTEKSAGIYNSVNDNALIILSEEMNREDLLEHVKRNLDMMFTYVEPDWSLFTYNSTRQDKGEGNSNQVFYPTAYYHLYLYMAYKLKNKEYAYMADYIFKNSVIWSAGYPGVLYLYMLKDELKEFESEMLPFNDNYHVYYRNSGIIRARKGDATYSILKDSSNFLFFQKGSLKCRIKLCASFFAKAQFKAQEIMETRNGYRLTFNTQGFYWMPFEEAPLTSDWRKMDHGKRQRVNVLDLVFNVYIEEYEKGLEVSFTAEGCDRVPVKVEFRFSPPCMVHGETFALQGEPGQSIVAKSGYVHVRKGIDTVTIGPAFANHTYATGMRGSEPQSKSGYTIYFTDFTPVNRKFRIELFGKNDIIK